MGALDDEQLHGLQLQAEVEGPLALLRAATSVNAELLGRDDLGRIGPGAVADLLDGDPRRDPSVLSGGPDRRAVFQGGTRVAGHAARLVLLSQMGREGTRRQSAGVLEDPELLGTRAVAAPRLQLKPRAWPAPPGCRGRTRCCRRLASGVIVRREICSQRWGSWATTSVRCFRWKCNPTGRRPSCGLPGTARCRCSGTCRCRRSRRSAATTGCAGVHRVAVLLGDRRAQGAAQVALQARRVVIPLGNCPDVPVGSDGAGVGGYRRGHCGAGRQQADEPSGQAHGFPFSAHARDRPPSAQSLPAALKRY